MDVSKLSPAPWTWRGLDDPGIESGNGGCVLHIQMHGNINTVNRTGEQFSHADAEFVCLARQAFDVMTERGWYAVPVGIGHWRVRNQGGYDMDCHFMLEGGTFNDPFTALVEAGKWMSEHEKAERLED